MTTDVGTEDATVANGEFDPTPTEDAQTTGTPTPGETETPTPTETPTSTPTPPPTETPGSGDDGDDDAGGTAESDGGADEDVDGADESNDTNATDADDGSRDPSDFEDAAGNGTADPDDTDGPAETAVESSDTAPEVESRSRQRMPARGPKNGTIVMSFEDAPVSTISFTRREYGNVTVDVLAGLPPGVESPAGDRLSTLRITVPDEVRDSPAKVMFTVDVETLEARGIPNDAVWLAHHDPETGTWDRLETRVVRASDDRVVYAANTPGFSLFAIQGDSSQVRSLVPVDAANDSGENETAADEAEATFLGGFGLSMGIVLFMGAVSVGTTVFGARRVSSVEISEEG